MLSVANLVRSPGDPKILESGPSSVYPEDRLAKSLGWFSLALGAVELFAAHRLTRALGIEGSEGLVRAFGLREIAAGVTTLSTEREAGLKSRVLGDVMDLAALMRIMSPYNPQGDNVRAACLAVLGITALDIFAAWSVATRKRNTAPAKDYSDRTGFPRPTVSAASRKRGAGAK